MKQFLKRSLSLLMALTVCLSLMAGVTFSVSAASYTYNWGVRETVATETDFARSTAEEWYDANNTSYEELSQLSGSSSNSSVPSSALYQRLRSLMRGAATNTTSYESIKTLCQYTDCQNGGGKISSFYSGTPIGPEWNSNEWNREHTWPNSKGDANGSGENDIFMLRPTSIQENSSRGSTAYGESGSYYHPNSESGGKYDLRGDVARIVLFVYVRWQDYNSSKAVLFGSSGVLENKDVMLKWMEEDPVDTWELGRNDACQSITGTRNVFVDYPELGFTLFGADIPDNYTTPSGEANAVSYNITATSNNTSYGTVSLSGKTITATPKTGYYVSGYTVTSGTATVTQSGNTFRVNPTSDCTIRINFAAKTAVTLSFMENGIAAKTVSSYGGDSVTLPSNTNTVAEGYSFLGWTDNTLSETTTKPTIYAPGTSVTASNKTYYAVYSRVDDEGSGNNGQWTLITETSGLRAGDQVILAYSDSNVVAGALSSTYLESLSATFSADKATITTLPQNVLILTLGGTSGAWTFANDAGALLGASGEKKLTFGGSNTSWTISISSGSATITNATGKLQYNSSAPRFTTYTSSQKLPQLYGMGGTVYYSTSTFVCEHEDTTTVAAVAATCTETGYTAGVYCNDCDQFTEGHTLVNALGHNWGAWVQTTAPTCTAAGTETATCSRCGNTKTQSVTATGHSYSSVVTKPTETQQGYTTYTCGTCGHSYKDNYTEALGQTFYVSFAVPKDVTPVATMECGKNGITLPSANAPEGYTFLGWTETPVEATETKPSILTGSYTANHNITLHAVYSYVEGGTGITEYVLTNISDIGTDDVFVITMTSSGTVYALPNNQTSTPTATAVTVANNKLNATPASTLLWNLSGSSSGYKFYPNGDTSKWLYCTDSSKGVKIGAVSDTFTIVDGYLKSASGTRYVGVYGGKDWRCYESPSVNIGGQTLGFYVKTESGTTYYTTLDPVAMVGDVEYTTFEAAFAAANGQFVTLLADTDVNVLTLEQDLYLDLNGHNFDVSCATGPAFKIYIKDSTTDDFETIGGHGNIYSGDVCAYAADGYVMNTDNFGNCTFNAYKLAITHVSLDANKDALGYKAELKGNEYAQASVSSYGFTMGVVGREGKEKTYEATGAIDDGVFTLRLNSIMKFKAGEKAINAKAFVVFNEDAENTVRTEKHTTSMKDTIVAVNEIFATLSDAQKAAVKELYGKYATVMAKWLEGKTNNIISA